MKIITTLLALFVAGSFACAAEGEGKKKEDSKSKKEEGSQTREGEKPGPRDLAKKQEEMFKQMRKLMKQMGRGGLPALFGSPT